MNVYANTVSTRPKYVACWIAGYRIIAYGEYYIKTITSKSKLHQLFLIFKRVRVSY